MCELPGFVFYGWLLTGILFFSHSNNLYSLILLIGIGKLMIFFSSPFKQSAGGMERFRLLAYMSVISNLIRCLGLIVVAALHLLSIQFIIVLFICGDVLELLIGVYLFRRATGIQPKIKWDKTAYFSLLHEALPQTGVVLITSALARFDWIFIGFMVSSVKLAEYSFAYKVFELSTLPLLAVAPLLIPRFTKLFQRGNVEADDLQFLLRMEMIAAVFIALLLNVCWSPVIDALTAGKYGAVNMATIFILSLCMPLLYLNNFLWTIYFTRGEVRMIFKSFLITFCVNVAGDIILIPFYKNEGAAFAFFAACIVQTAYYINQNNIAGLNKLYKPLLICTGCGITSGLTAKMLFPESWLMVPLALLFYGCWLFITNQLSLKDRQSLWLMLRR
ncbi:hypothetical protein BH09BAC6_BH09BAC6_04630 [soil metagenome]